MTIFRGYLHRGNHHPAPSLQGDPDFVGSLKDAEAFMKAMVQQRKIQPLPVKEGGPELVLFRLEQDQPAHVMQFGAKGGIIVRALS